MSELLSEGQFGLRSSKISSMGIKNRGVIRRNYSTEQYFYIIRGDGFEEAAFGTDKLINQFLFTFLQLQDLFFDGVTGDEFINENGFILADAVGAVSGLHFDGRIPPRVQMDNVIGGGQVQADPAGFQADQEEWNAGVVLEQVNLRLTILGFPIQVGIP